MHTVLCQPGRPPPCSHFPQAWAFLFPTDISPLSVQLSKPVPGDAPPKKRGGGKAFHSTFPAPDKAPSFQLSAVPAGRQRQRPGVEGSWGRGRRSSPSVPLALWGPQILEPGLQGEMGVPPPPQVWQGKGEGTREGPGSGSWKARTGAALRSAVSLALRPPRPPFCPKES